MRIRLTVEYDADVDADSMTDNQIREFLIREKEDWLQGNVGVYDVVTADDSAVFTLVNI